MPIAIPLSTTPQYLIRKKISTNWSKNPRNCHVMLKLLGDCLVKSTKPNPCHVYNNLLVECQKVSKINYPRLSPNI